MLTAGYAQAKITPSLERTVYLAGYRSNKPAQRVHDDLWVRALALRLNGSVVVLATLDLIGLARQHCLAIESAVREKTGIHAEVLVCCSHTHFGPDTIGLWGSSETQSGIDPVYFQWLMQTVIDTIIAALNTEPQPVHSRSSAIDVRGVAKNIRTPAITDEEATFVQFITEAKNVLVTLVIFPCHPEGVDEESTDISGDYVYGLRQKLEADFGGAAMFMPGALGGMMTPVLGERTHAEAQKMGETVAAVAQKILSDAPLMTIEHLSFGRQTVNLPMKNVLFEMAMQSGLLPNTLTAAHEFITEAGLIKIGDVWLATIPGELLPRLGKQIKTELKQAGAKIAGVVCLANDELGYILPADDFIFPKDWLNPGAQYEESMSVGPDTAPLLMNALYELLSRGIS
jgi:hypothetical protein